MSTELTTIESLLTFLVKNKISFEEAAIRNEEIERERRRQTLAKIGIKFVD